MKILIKIPDMTCDHCKMTISKALEKIPEVHSVKIDIQQQTADVEGAMPVDEVMQAIRGAGYTVGEILSAK